MLRVLCVLAMTASTALLGAVEAPVSADSGECPGLLVPPKTVNNSLSFVNFAYATEGELSADFRATQLSDGTWSVEASFRPKPSLRIFILMWDLGGYWARVRGSASGPVIAAPGVPLQLDVPGLSYVNSNGIKVAFVTSCALLVGADGVVTVQSIFV